MKNALDGFVSRFEQPWKGNELKEENYSNLKKLNST